ncbi:MAG TPA: pseudouridine synthase [Sandaracinaceae bacterium LLY-WYZ-13_1]|nr:pseudouridine synthase [Sandaracinaceae bacterium LLY-WYZ-13_1]
MASERLQKILAHAGVASRRAAEKLIVAGRVRVNGRVTTELGSKADPHRDKVEVDGKRVVLEKPVHYLVHKPREMVTTLHDPEGRAALGDLLSKLPERVYPVGRLDYHTSGALLVTNDGELTEALLNPRRKVPKVYAAKLKGYLDVPELDQLRNGVTLDDGYVTQKAEVFVIREESKNTWVQITLTEGKNRQIHRMAEAIGHPVQRLARLSFAGLDTDGLRPGELRPLNGRELEKLKKHYLRPARRQKAERAADEAIAAGAPVVDDGGPARRGKAGGGRKPRGKKRGARKKAGSQGKRGGRR